MAKAAKLPIIVEDLHLTQKEVTFLLEYCTNRYDPVDAFKKAKLNKPGQSDIEIKLESSALVNKREIKIGVQRFTESVVSPFRDRMEAMLLETDRVRAFYDVADFFDDNGRPKKLSEIPKDLRIVIDGINEDFKGKDANVRTVTMKIADRNVAMKNLRTALKIGGETGEEKPDIPNEARTRVSEIFKAGIMGIKEGERRARTEMKKADIPGEPEIEIITEEIEPVPEPSYIPAIRQDLIEEEQLDKEVEQAPIVQKANKILKGMNLPPDHPLLQKGRELAAQHITKVKERENENIRY